MVNELKSHLKANMITYATSGALVLGLGVGIFIGDIKRSKQHVDDKLQNITLKRTKNDPIKTIKHSNEVITMGIFLELPTGTVMTSCKHSTEEDISEDSVSRSELVRLDKCSEDVIFGTCPTCGSLYFSKH